MNTWIYKGERYKTVSIPDKIEVKENSIVYVPKWDKCFYLRTLGYHGNGSREKAYIEDIYTHKLCWIEAK